MSNLGPVTRFRLNQLAKGDTGPQGPPGPPGPAGGAGSVGQSTTTLVNGLNSNIPTSSLATLRLSGPSASFSVGGFAPLSGTPTAGQSLDVVNTTAQPMTIVHEDTSSVAAVRISVPGAVSVVQIASGKTARFVYDGVALRWLLQSLGLERPGTYHAGDFGAVGDNATDNTLAIQNAIAAACASGNVAPVLEFPAGIFLTGPIALAQAANSGLTLRGSGCGSQLAGGRATVLKLNTPSSYLLQVQGLNIHIEDIWLHGGNSAAAVVSMSYLCNLVHFERCVISNAVVTTGNLVDAPGTLEITKVKFDQCYIIQDPLDGTKFCNACFHTVNSDANGILFEGCYLSNAAYIAYMIQGCASFEHCFAFAFTTAAFAFECVNLACEIFDVYTEQTNVPFGLELNTMSGQSGLDVVRFSHCNIQDNGAAVSYETFSLICKQAVIIEHCSMSGNVAVNPDATAGLFPPMLDSLVWAYNYPDGNGAIAGVTGHPEFANIRNCAFVYSSNGQSLGTGAKVRTYSQDCSKALNPIAFGFIPDALSVLDGAGMATGTALTCATSAPFALGDVGKDVIIPGAAAAAGRYVGSITAFIDSAHVTVFPAFGTTVAGARVDFGTKTDIPMVALETAQAATELPILWDPGKYLLLQNFTLGAMRFARGAQIILGNLAVATLTVSPEADADQQIFSNPLGGGGTVVFPITSPRVPPAWLGYTGSNIDSLDPRSFGMVSDGATFYDAAITATDSTLSSASSTPFVVGDVGKTVVVVGAGASSARYSGVITGFTDSNHVTVSPAAGTTVSGSRCDFGSANASPFANLIAAQTSTGLKIEWHPGTYFTTGGGTVTGGMKFHRGASLIIANQATVTVEGFIEADPDQQIFSDPKQSGGVVAFTAGALQRVGPNWFGGLGYSASAVTMANGANNNLASPLTDLVEVSGPSGSYSFSGMAPPIGGVQQQRTTYEFVFFANQQLTIKHLSTSTTANQIQCPTAADIILSAPGAGGFHTIKLRYSYGGNGGYGAWLLVDYE